MPAALRRRADDERRAPPPLPEVVASRQRAHRARAVRVRIVALAQEYRAACRQHEEVMLRLNEDAPTWLLKEEEQTWEGMKQRREALFAALEELEGLEGEEQR